MNETRLIIRLREYGADIEGIIDRFMGDAELFEECFGKFLSDKNFTLLGRAIEENDAGTAFKAAHSLKGLVANMGLPEIYDQICGIVEVLRAGGCGELGERYERLMQALRSLAEYVKE